MITKEDYLKRAEQEYEELLLCENHARKLERDIAAIREMGFKVIVLGAVVKVTRNKQGH